jgi:cyclohexa-1,5-dienecarbonyl-CoA hydratase
MSVTVSFNQDQTRAAFVFFHPKGNIITAEIVQALRTGLESVSDNPRLKLITIEGHGADFSFGASIPEHAPDQIAEVLPEMHALIQDFIDVPAVTAAIARGRCLGGGFEIALACDLIFAADEATLGLPEISLGVFPPAGCVLLPLRLGAARATRAILTGESQSARHWYDTGLIEMLAPSETLHQAVDLWFGQHLAGKSAAALRHAAAAARAGVRAHIRTVLPEVERLYLDELMRTHDAVEGIEAFLQKREPRWQHR